MNGRFEGKLQYKLNLPSDLKAALEDHAKRSRRSLSSEIIARLQAGIADELSAAPSETGLAAFPMAAIERMLTRLETSVSGSHQLFLEMREETRRLGGGITQVENYRLEPALQRFMAEQGIERGEAVRRILGEWLGSRGYVTDAGNDPQG